MALQRKHVDLLRSCLQVHESVAEINGALHRGPTKTYEKRSVVLPRFVRDMLEVHLHDNVGRAPDSLVFTAPNGGPLRNTNFRKRIWDPVVQETEELPSKLTPHHLRHTCASLLIKTGAIPRLGKDTSVTPRSRSRWTSTATSIQTRWTRSPTDSITRTARPASAARAFEGSDDG